MWEKFFKPLLGAYKHHPDFSQDLYDEVYLSIYDSTHALGGPHSFRCEFIWLRTRVRYFELLPTWEI
jgi:hypothetical protein